MDTSSLSGLLVVVGIGVAITLFVPAWAKRSETIHEVREATRSAKQNIRSQARAQQRAIRHTSVTRQALNEQLVRIQNVRRLLAFAFMAGLATAGLTAFSFATLWLASVVSAAVSAVALVANRALAHRQMALLEDQQAVRAVPAVSYRDLYRQAAPEAFVAAAPAVEDRTWTPRHMPAPLHAGHIGSLEQPVLAEVKAIRVEGGVAASAAATSENLPIGANLDEILRRRRAV